MKRESKFVDISGYFAVLYFSLPFEFLQNKKWKRKTEKQKKKREKICFGPKLRTNAIWFTTYSGTP